MRSNNAASDIRDASTRRTTLQGVKIGSNLIAFYPQAIHRPQPYVILLDPAKGMLRRLDLQAAK